MKFPVNSLLAGNLAAETGSLMTGSSSGESANPRSQPYNQGHSARAADAEHRADLEPGADRSGAGRTPCGSRFGTRVWCVARLQLTAGIIGAEMIALGRSVEPAIYSPIIFFTVSEAISVMIFTAMS